MLFNLIVNKLIVHVKSSAPGYQLTRDEVKILCYVDDAVLISDNDLEFQRFLYTFFTVVR